MFFNIFGSRASKQHQIKPVVLVIMDGFGIAPPSAGNATTLAKMPNYNQFLKDYPHTELIASGESVGLPANEEGNTEVGHFTLGAGRTMYQDLKRINVAIEDTTFYDNRALLSASSHVKKFNSRIHIFGLASSGNVHSSLEHLFSLIQFCKKEDLKEVYLHLFTDGRDAPPQEGIEIIKSVEEYIENVQAGAIASISGRYYAMDRDRRWERTKLAYSAIVLGQGKTAESAQQAVEASYKTGKTDEFVEPTVITKNGRPVGLVQDNDAVVFFNFRVDRPRQLTMAFVLPDFERLKSFEFGFDPDTNIREGKVGFSATFERGKILKNLFFVTMTEYQKNLPVNAIAFGPEVVENSLPVVLSQAGLNQMHMSESEKERFVTYCFDGAREETQPNEDVQIIPSPKVATYDKKPEMSLPELTKAFKKQLAKDKYHFFVMNIANPDMVGHSGSLEATIKAVEYVDEYLAEIIGEVLRFDGTLLITADHGNAEELLTYSAQTFFYTTARGSMNTDHSNNPVPLLVISNSLKGSGRKLQKGALYDVAPTILALMGISKPKEMTGQDLMAMREEGVGNE